MEIKSRNKEEIYIRKGLKKILLKKYSKIIETLKIEIHNQAVNYKIRWIRISTINKMNYQQIN